MKPKYPKAPYCKESYIGAPVKSVVHACEYCSCAPGTHADGCTCPCHCNQGICSVVVDDANEKVYLYGSILHENYHVPGNECVPYTAVTSAGFNANGRKAADEYFVGAQDNNNVVLTHTPILGDNTFFVFLNGVKQREGAEHDYTINDNIVHFNFYNLLSSDTVEVMYEYGEE